MGSGLALRWAKNYDIILGSRSLDKARKTAEELTEIARGFYQDKIHGSISGANKQAENLVCDSCGYIFCYIRISGVF